MFIDKRNKILKFFNLYIKNRKIIINWLLSLNLRNIFMSRLFQNINKTEIKLKNSLNNLENLYIALFYQKFRFKKEEQ